MEDRDVRAEVRSEFEELANLSEDVIILIESGIRVPTDHDVKVIKKVRSIIHRHFFGR